MKHSIDEKLRYNRQRKTPFSSAYCLGVTVYRDYAQADKQTKAVTRDMIDRNKQAARNGDPFAKGFMCGIRDAANERKQK